jgi:DNA-binding transcriptional MerR regulator
MSRPRKCISLQDVSEFFSIEVDECREFADFGLITIISKRNETYIEPQDFERLKRIVSLYRDLGVNKEGIEIILSMRTRIIELQEEIDRLNHKVERMENEYVHEHIEKTKKLGIFFEL